jgi:hypothetical protein
MPHSHATTIQAQIAGMNATSRAATDFEDPDPKHESVGGHPGQWREVLVPVDEKVKELVDARTERINPRTQCARRPSRRAGRLSKILKTKRRS